MKEIEFTGERAVPGKTPPDEWKRHTERYKWASEKLRGLTVLDYGCGTGYGSAILAKTAKAVLGIDISQEAISYAKMHYKGLQFHVMDAMKTPIKNASFDAVVCFEMIEHVQNAEKALLEIWRILAPGGILIISCPNITKNFLIKRQQKSWKWHLGFFDYAGFLKLISSRFEVLGQYYQERAFLAFPGRGIAQKALGIQRDYKIRPMVAGIEPKTIIFLAIKPRRYF